ncbi:MAG TPA: hypothetical protein VNH64_08625 [Parvularculaceae bacterium]|nr:hypothetical protein [Parvularculaceae bacterium]
MGGIMATRALACSVAAAFFLNAGCAGFVSTPVAPPADGAPKPAQDGVYYYLPVKPIVVQAAIDAKGVMTVSLAKVAAAPDRAHPYLLRLPENYLSTNNTVIKVGPNGLLQTASSEEKSGLDALVKAAGAGIGTISGALGIGESELPCEKSHTYTLYLWPEDKKAEGEICQAAVHVTAFGGASPLADTRRSSGFDRANAGIFYKTEIPYLVSVEFGGRRPQQFIAYSPNEAPIQFAPLKRALFANNKTTFTLTDGVLTKAESNVDGEITGFVALPADFIGAYMKAVGEIFSSLKSNDSARNGLAVSDAQRQLCEAAVAANPIEGADSAKDAASYAAIKAACGN